MALVGLSVVEQRLDTVRAVLAGAEVGEVAGRGNPQEESDVWSVALESRVRDEATAAVNP